MTARERDILALLAKGYDNQTIANELFISLKTVKTHVSNNVPGVKPLLVHRMGGVNPQAMKEA